MLDSNYMPKSYSIIIEQKHLKRVPKPFWIYLIKLKHQVCQLGILQKLFLPPLQALWKCIVFTRNQVESLILAQKF